MTINGQPHAVHHIGADGTGLGGIFDLDSNTVRVGIRFTAPYAFTPEALWIYCSGEGLGAQGVRMRFADGSVADTRQPNTSATSIRWIPAANFSPGWVRLELTEASGTSLKVLHAAGSIVHVTFERQTGTFSQSTITAGSYDSFTGTPALGMYLTGETSGATCLVTAIDTGALTFDAQVLYGVPVAGETLSVTTHSLVNIAITFTQGAHLRFYSARSRFPSPYMFVTSGTPDAVDSAPIRDDMFGLMYTSDLNSTAEPYCTQRGGNAAYQPLFLVECLDAPSFGNPYDVHEVVPVYGHLTYAQTMLLPEPLGANSFSMQLRGAAQGGDPTGELMLSIYRARRQFAPWRQRIFGPAPIVVPDDRLFIGRSHWFTTFVDTNIDLRSGDNSYYTFEVEAPECRYEDAWDAYLFSYDYSTLPATAPIGMLGRTAYAELNRQRIVNTATAALVLGEYVTPVTIASIDEINGEITAPTPSTDYPMFALAGDTVQIDVLARNMAAVSTTVGGQIFSRILYYDSGTEVSAAAAHADMAANDEGVDVSHTFTMDATDMHMLVQVGHVEPAGLAVGDPGTTLVVDDSCQLEIRVAV